MRLILRPASPPCQCQRPQRQVKRLRKVAHNLAQARKQLWQTDPSALLVGIGRRAQGLIGVQTGVEQRVGGWLGLLHA